MYNVFVGKQRSLVFPVMCNGFATIDYAENTPDAGTSSDVTDDVTYGIWAHTGSFTLEAIVTPYDIMGAGTTGSGQTAVPNRLTSKKIFPAHLSTETNDAVLQGETYLDKTERDTHEMAIFHSTNFSLFLVNEALDSDFTGTHPNSMTGRTRNNPARYKIMAKIKIGSNAVRTFTSPVVIEPNRSSFVKYSSADDLTGLVNGRTEFIKIGDATSIAASGTADPAVGFGGTDRILFSSIDFSEVQVTGTAGLKGDLFIRQNSQYINIGFPVAATGGNGLHFTINSISSENKAIINAGCEVFARGRADPAYVNNSFHIACSFDNTSREVSIYINGSRILKEIHQDSGNFIFAREDLFLGANGQGNTGAGSASTNKQFMGEFHELSIVNKRKDVFSTLTNLTPTYSDALVYLRFEEVDE